MPTALANTTSIPHHDHAGIRQHLDEHGWAVASEVITTSMVDALATDVRRLLGDSAGDPYHMSFIEDSLAALDLIEYEPYMMLYRALVSDQLTVHRSAAILRQPGSAGMGWHSDFNYRLDAPTTVDGVLNRGEWLNGMWFYLTGCRREHGGLAVIPGSHRPDWQAPTDYSFAPDRRALLSDDGTPATMDIPGSLALRANPCDLILFSARTWHAAHPHTGNEPRLSCGVGFRPRSAQITAPWPLPSTARAMRDRLPARLAPLFANYVGIQTDWTPHPAR